MNSHRSISPTPRTTQAKPLHPGGAKVDGQQTVLFPPPTRRHITNQEKTVLQTMTVDERDIELLKEFMEKYQGNLKVMISPLSLSMIALES